MYCRNCGIKVPDNMEYCPYCGMKLTTQKSYESGRSFFGGKKITSLVRVLVLLLFIAVMLLMRMRTRNNAGDSSETDNNLTPSASLGDTSSSSATTDTSAAASEADVSAQEAADASTADSLPASDDADSYEKKEEAPVITCDVKDLVLQIGESREVLITASGSNLPDSLSITVTSIQGIVDWEWEEWVDNRSVKATVTGMIEGDVHLEIYFSDGNDESEEPAKLASTYLNVKVIPNEEEPVEEKTEVIDTRRSVDDVFRPDGTFFTYDGHTYCFYDVYTINENKYGNVTDAGAGAYKNIQKFCRDQDGHLAVINSIAENEVLFDETQERYDHTAFFGLSDENREGRWIWDDGTEDTLSLWSVKNGVQQPDNGNGYTVEHYAEFDYDRFNPEGSDNTGNWNDAAYLKNTSIFICEWDYVLKGL